MKLNLRMKMIIGLLALAVIAGVACGVRAYLDSQNPQNSAASALPTAGAFASNESYEPTAEVQEINEQAANIIGGKENADALQTGVEKWCAETIPEATTCSWDETVVLDYSSGTATFGFKLDDANKTIIAATVYIDNGRVVINKVV